MSAQPITTAFTFGSAFGSEGINMLAADCSAAKLLLRSNRVSRVLMSIPPSLKPLVRPTPARDQSVTSEGNSRRFCATTQHGEGGVESLELVLIRETSLRFMLVRGWDAPGKKGFSRFITRSFVSRAPIRAGVRVVESRTTSSCERGRRGCCWLLFCYTTAHSQGRSFGQAPLFRERYILQ